MIKDLTININRETREVNLPKSFLGNDGENLQSKLVFKFDDEFIIGQARLEYEMETEDEKSILSLIKKKKAIQHL